jgi:dihydrofolate synthase/folylpolyglutamate synthase
MKLGLAAIDGLCERLGRPERAVPSVLIAGTNGKGSTAATLSAIARVSGIRAGLYTSPHLVDVTERVRLDEEDVSRESLDQTLGRVFAAADSAPEIPLTYFEAMTAAAFVLFRESGIALAVLEVGLGGRFDATNLAPACLSMITSISLDHTEELGSTIASIAREKAGIFRRGRPALVEGTVEAREVFRAAAASAGAVLHEMAEEVSLEIEKPSLEQSRFRLRTPERDYSLFTPLLGAHQACNAATAVRGAELLSPEFRIPPEAIRRGVASVRWPGRLERFVVRGRSVYLDGCHNPEGAESLARFLACAPLRPDLLFGAMADKDVEAMVGALAGAVSEIRLVPLNSPRGATPEELRRRVESCRPDASPASTLEEALRERLSQPGDKPIIVAGSLYLVGEARALLLSGQLGGCRNDL